jgi:hypothetical protein
MAEKGIGAGVWKKDVRDSDGEQNLFSFKVSALSG